jgi:solute carrier family 35 protein C2
MDDASPQNHPRNHHRATPPSPSTFPLTRIPSTSSLSARSTDDILPPDAAAALADIHSPDLNMQPEPSGHRRRKSSLMNALDGSKGIPGKPRRTSRSPTKRNDILEEPKPGDAVDDDSSKSTSEDVELDDLSEDGLQDDEETGLTGKDKGRRKQRRRRNTLLDQRIAGDIKITEEEKKEADQNVFKKSLVNGILIGLWYIFSLSISIVSYTVCHVCFTPPNFTSDSTTNGCSQPTTSISISPYLRHVCICWCNSVYPHSSYISSLNSDLDTTPSRTPIIPKLPTRI